MLGNWGISYTASKMQVHTIVYSGMGKCMVCKPGNEHGLCMYCLCTLHVHKQLVLSSGMGYTGGHEPIYLACFPNKRKKEKLTVIITAKMKETIGVMA